MTVSAAYNSAEDRQVAKTPLKVRLRRQVYHRAIRLLTLAYCVALCIVGALGPRRQRRASGNGWSILLTGRFDSDNWIISHLGPLAASKQCSRLWMVATDPLPAGSGATGIYPSEWLIRIIGATPARLITLAWAALRLRPDIVGGFHLLVNGMAATVVARLVGARAMYFCVGGPNEVRDGGVWGEGNYFAKMETPDPVVERRLLKAVSACDMVITMGTGAVKFFRDRGINSPCHVVSGGIDSRLYSPGAGPRTIDLVMIGRLVPIKRVDVLLETVEHIARHLTDVQAVIVGDGALRPELERLAEALGISQRVSFVGYQRDVDRWLSKARLFLLTSDSEGLPLVAIEAMMCGLPVVASDVGDLADLVEDGVNGYLVSRRSPPAFAQRAIELLRDSAKLQAFSKGARQSALRYDTSRAIRQWDAILDPPGRLTRMRSTE